MDDLLDNKLKEFSNKFDLGAIDFSKYTAGRTSFQLERFVMQEHDLPERKFLQLMMELKSMRDGFIGDCFDIEKLKIARRSRPSPTEETKHKIALGNTGKVVPLESRQRIAKAKIGNKNPMFGKIWITDGRINGLIENKDELPEGWYFGQTKKSFNN